MPKHKSMPSIVPTKILYVLSVLVYIVLLLLVPDQKYSNKEYVLTEAFVPRCHYQPSRSAAITTSPSTSANGKMKRKTVSSSSLLWYAESPEDSLLSEMKSPDMKMELESYGISTKSMFDKKEFETALQEARRRKGGLEDKRKTKVTTTNTSSTVTKKKHFKQEVATSSDSSAEKGKNKNKTREKKKSSIWNGIASAAKEVLDSNAKKFSDSVSSSSTKEKSSSFSAATSNNSKNNTRQQRYEVALKEGAAMKISKLKNELTDRGISTVSYFEKSDLIDAYANAIADNSVSNDKTSPTNKGTTNTDRRSSNDAIFDPSYKNVIMSSFDLSTMILPGEVVIDITAA